MARRYPAVAQSVLLDKSDGSVWIDGQRLPAAILADYEITSEARGIDRLTVSMLARSVAVLHTLHDDLQWVQDVADMHRIELGLPAKHGRVNRAPF